MSVPIGRDFRLSIEGDDGLMHPIRAIVHIPPTKAMSVTSGEYLQGWGTGRYDPVAFAELFGEPLPLRAACDVDWPTLKLAEQERLELMGNIKHSAADESPQPLKPNRASRRREVAKQRKARL